MARVDSTTPLQASVLDCLLDSDPANPREAPRGQGQVLQGIKLAVQRDLENLFNTRCRCLRPPEDLTELQTSLVSYGIEDFTGSSRGSDEDWEELRLILEGTIRRFEPRLRNVRVQLADRSRAPEDRVLHFRIDALLDLEPACEVVTFDSNLDLASVNFEVKRLGR